MRSCCVDVVEAAIDQSKTCVANALLGEPDVVRHLHRPTFIVTARYLFEALSEEGGPEEVRWSLVKDAEPTVDSEELMKAVKILVEENLLSYVDPFTVSLHAQRLKWAYLKHVQKSKEVVGEFETAQKLIKVQ